MKIGNVSDIDADSNTSGGDPAIHTVHLDRGGDDVIEGGDGRDDIVAGMGDDVVMGGADADLVAGQSAMTGFIPTGRSSGPAISTASVHKDIYIRWPCHEK